MGVSGFLASARSLGVACPSNGNIGGGGGGGGGTPGRADFVEPAAPALTFFAVTWVEVLAFDFLLRFSCKRFDTLLPLVSARISNEQQL